MLVFGYSGGPHSKAKSFFSRSADRERKGGWRELPMKLISCTDM